MSDTRVSSMIPTVLLNLLETAQLLLQSYVFISHCEVIPRLLHVELRRHMVINLLIDLFQVAYSIHALCLIG